MAKKRAPKQETEQDVQIGEIQEWRQHPVTQMIWTELARVRDAQLASLPAALAKRDYAEAANWNAAYEAMKEVVIVPDNVIEELRGEKDHAERQ